MRFHSSLNIFPTIFLKYENNSQFIGHTETGCGLHMGCVGSSFATSGLDKCEHLVMKKLLRLGLPETIIGFISLSLHLSFHFSRLRGLACWSATCVWVIREQKCPLGKCCTVCVFYASLWCTCQWLLQHFSQQQTRMWKWSPKTMMGLKDSCCLVIAQLSEFWNRRRYQPGGRGWCWCQ